MANYSDSEKETQKVALLLLYLSLSLGDLPDDGVYDDATSIAQGTYPYIARLDRYNALLAWRIQHMTHEQRAYILDVPHPTAKVLKEWWEERQATEFGRLEEVNRQKVREAAQQFIRDNPMDLRIVVDELKKMLAVTNYS
jgi:hypothetical protein